MMAATSRLTSGHSKRTHPRLSSRHYTDLRCAFTMHH